MVTEFKINIEAASPEEAKEILSVSLDLMKSMRAVVGAKEYVRLAKKISQNPSLVNKVKFFI